MDNVLEMLPDGMQVEQRATISSGRRTVVDAKVQSLPNLPDVDAMRAWLEVQWDILRGAGLLR